MVGDTGDLMFSFRVARRSHIAVPLRACVVALTIGLTACHDAPTNSERKSTPVLKLIKVAGDTQSATVGTPVAVRPSVRVETDQGRPVLGVLVEFTVSYGDGL